MNQDEILMKKIDDLIFNKSFYQINGFSTKSDGQEYICKYDDLSDIKDELKKKIEWRS